MKVYAALTFDDGYLTHSNIAYLLYKQGIRATFFIITHLKKFENKPLLTINPRGIQLISDMGHEIGSHSCTHPFLDRIPMSRVEQELRESKLYLERLIGKEVKGFAYPYGSYNKSIISVVRKFYRYARLGGRRFEAKTWNAYKLSSFMIEGITPKELVKFPIKYILYKNIRPVLIFHDEPIKFILNIIKILQGIGVEFITLSELVDIMFSN